MKCPHCGDRKAIDLDMHSNGYTSEAHPLKECGSCGLVWRVTFAADGEAKIDIVKQAEKK